ncbi:MAG: hypothetical protein Q4F69_11860 [Bacteroidia bacterium]|nr:hypothetical protein [Bacteroidia bacterium]
MKRIIIVIGILSVLLGLSQCRKPVFGSSDINTGDCERTVTFMAGGNGKGDFELVSGALKYKWNENDKIYVYCFDDGMNAKGFAGVLTTTSSNISAGGYSARFDGKVKILSGSTKFRFIHFGSYFDDEIMSGDDINTVEADFSSQDGDIATVASKSVSVCDTKITSDCVYDDNCKLKIQYALLKMDLSNLVGANLDGATPSGVTSIAITGNLQNNKIKIDNKGVISYVVSSSATTMMTISNPANLQNVYVIVATAGGNYPLVFTNGKYEGKIELNLESNKFYHGSEESNYSFVLPCYVDLGIGKWATCNVGALHPGESGDYFQWGGVEPVTGTVGWKGCPHTDCDIHGVYSDDHKNVFTKYTTDNAYVASGYSVDNKTELEAVDDAATKNYGSGWCMPTREQFEELLKCTCLTLENYKGTKVKGMLIYKDDATVNIFLPTSCSYWTRTVQNSGSSLKYNQNAYSYASDADGFKGRYRCNGRSVRPVRK